MFIEKVEELLKERKIRKKDFLSDLGLARTSFGNWRDRGTVPSGATLQKIADYLGVSVDYLLGTEERNIYITGNYGTGKSTIITQSFDAMVQEKTKRSPSASDEDIKFALFGGEGEITDEMWEAVREYAQFVKEKYGKK